MKSMVPARARDDASLAFPWFDRRLDGWFDSLFGVDWPFDALERKFSPALSVSEKADGYEVRAEVPGIDPKDVEVSVEDGVLTIQGRKNVDLDDKAAHTHNERFFGEFVRSLTLPDTCDPEKATASYSNGVLTVRLAKRESAKRKPINVEVK